MKNRRSLYALLCASLLALTATEARASVSSAVQQTAEAKQPNMQQIKERVRAEKRAFLIKKLELTEQEANAIMPLLNELDDKRFLLWNSSHAMWRRIKRGDKSLTDKELRAHADLMLNNQVKEAELERTYYKKCASLLPAAKYVRLSGACKDFARQFFERRHKP